MPLTIRSMSSNGDPDLERRDMTAELLDIFAGWSTSGRVAAFRRWQRGSLSIIQLTVLAILKVEERLTMGGLAAALGVSIASATGIVKRMEARDLVSRSHDEEDRRIVVVRCATAGADVFEEMQQRRRTRLERLLARLDDDELVALRDGLVAMRRARLDPSTPADEGETP